MENQVMPNDEPPVEVNELPLRRKPHLGVLGIVVLLLLLAGWALYTSMPEGLRNADCPQTFIDRIELDLASPNHWVTLTWTGPRATEQPKGPFRSTPGKGEGSNDCNDVAESNRSGSNCTPKGTRFVEGFNDHMPSAQKCKYVTWIDKTRAIGFHSFPSVSSVPASQGCVRMEEHAARLIHDNSVIGKTQIVIGGTWARDGYSGL
jgi:hypothetical protein